MGDSSERPRRVAIACQGGGSHTAFTAGVLKRLFDSEALANHEVVGLSGTSGGAVCALLAWYALLNDDRRQAGKLLDAFWADNSATTPFEWLLNSWMIWASRFENVVVTPAVNPYDTSFSLAGARQFKALLERRVDFDRIDVQADDMKPMLLVGAVEVLSGEFRAFNSRHDQITADIILASAAIPTLFRAVRLPDGTYWDGLFSQNPPVRELIDAGPDEIWVIQINPRGRDAEPRTVAEIADRRNELSGNLSLHQELGFIEKIDQLLDEGLLRADGKYRQIVVRVIELPRSQLSRALGTVSKLNRDPAFIRELMSSGEQQAEDFLAALAFEEAWRTRDVDAVLRFFSEDAQLVSWPPFQRREPCYGLQHIRPFVLEHLAPDVVVDLTRKQVARDEVVWTVRTRHDAGHRLQGHAKAQFRDGKITAFRLGAG